MKGKIKMMQTKRELNTNQYMQLCENAINEADQLKTAGVSSKSKNQATLKALKLMKQTITHIGKSYAKEVPKLKQL